MVFTISHGLSEKEKSDMLLRASQAILHTMGVAIREVPMTVVKSIRQMAGKSAAQIDALVAAAPTGTPKRKRMEFARTMHGVLKKLNDARFCREPIDDAFLLNVTEGRHRTDTAFAVALRFGNPDAQRRTSVAYSAIGAWGAASDVDYIDIGDAPDQEVTMVLGRNQASPLNQMLREGRVAEIDLVCAASAADAGHVPSVGKYLTALLAARIAQKKKAGQRRFKAVLVRAAWKRAGGRRGSVTMPFKRALESLGFAQTPTRFIDASGASHASRSDTNHGETCFVIQDTPAKTWMETVASKFTRWDREFEALCPMQPRSGRSYCL